jgi:hypothetical protein
MVKVATETRDCVPALARAGLRSAVSNRVDAGINLNRFNRHQAHAGQVHAGKTAAA